LRLSRVRERYPAFGEVEEFVRKVAAQKPLLILLFGSLATGEFTQHSGFFQTEWRSEIVFRPLEPIEETITGKFSSLDLADLELELSTTDITSLNFDLVTLEVASD